MKLKYISWIPAVIVMVVIFLFSAKPAVTSNDSSKIIAAQVLELYEKITNNEIDTNVRDVILDKLNHVVRKSAHYLEYALLAWCICLHLAVLKLGGKKLFAYAILCSAAYALTDEIHQYFVPGRSCQLTDVLLDSFGAATGALLFLMMHFVFSKVKLKRKNANPLPRNV